MRQLIINEKQEKLLINQLLKEYYRGNLYHSSPLLLGIKIMEDNCLNSSEETEGDIDNPTNFISFSRSKNYFTKTLDFVRFNVDVDKIMSQVRNVKMKPYDFGYHEMGIRPTQQSEYDGKFESCSEFEERLYTYYLPDFCDFVVTANVFLLKNAEPKFGGQEITDEMAEKIIDYGNMGSLMNKFCTSMEGTKYLENKLQMLPIEWKNKIKIYYI